MYKISCAGYFTIMMKVIISIKLDKISCVFIVIMITIKVIIFNIKINFNFMCKNSIFLNYKFKQL